MSSIDGSLFMSVSVLQLDLDTVYAGFSLRVQAEIPLQGVTAIFGPSGSGKSTLLRLIAGLERPQRGRIMAGPDVWVDAGQSLFRKPHRRSVGIVMQGAPLLNHLSVRGNLTYAAQRQGDRPAAYPFSRVVESLDLEPLLARRPPSLSGGERQRVALAQAILTRPDLLLLDEPLSALDRARKAEILPYLQDLSSRFDLPILLVSHDVDEVVRLADRVMVLKAGSMVDFGPVTETLNRHGFDRDTMDREGAILSGIARKIDRELDLMEVEIGADTLFLPREEGRQIGDVVPILIRASDVALALQPPEGLSIRNALRGRVASIRRLPNSAFAEVGVDLGVLVLPVRITRAAVEALSLRAGQNIWALVKTTTLAG